LKCPCVPGGLFVLVFSDAVSRGTWGVSSLDVVPRETWAPRACRVGPRPIVSRPREGTLGFSYLPGRRLARCLLGRPSSRKETWASYSFLGRGSRPYLLGRPLSRPLALSLRIPAFLYLLARPFALTLTRWKDFHLLNLPPKTLASLYLVGRPLVSPETLGFFYLVGGLLTYA